MEEEGLVEEEDKDSSILCYECSVVNRKVVVSSDLNFLIQSWKLHFFVVFMLL